MKRWTSLLVLALLLLSACRTSEVEVPDPAPSVYYWRSEFRLSEAERLFLHDHRVGKLYLHLFDVVRDGETVHPTSTLQITDSVPAGVEVIPVVFLNHDLLRDTTGIAALPRLLALRIKQMMEQNGLGLPREMQIDFDWTRRNEQCYFQLLEQLREALRQEGIGRLSATIRLHQLAMAAPPVDYGALMVYNVGNYADPRERCSILTPEGVVPYLRHLPHYPLPLCTALPVYRWNLLYHGDHFECIVRGVNLQDSTRFERLDDSHYRSLSYQAIPLGAITLQGDGRILPGDIVRHESVPMSTLDSVRQMLHQTRPSVCRQIILYHLDEHQLYPYNNEELDNIYTGGGRSLDPAH